MNNSWSKSTKEAIGSGTKSMTRNGSKIGKNTYWYEAEFPNHYSQFAVEVFNTLHSVSVGEE